MGQGKEENVKLDIKEFINMGALLSDMGFNTLTRIPGNNANVEKENEMLPFSHILNRKTKTMKLLMKDIEGNFYDLELGQKFF